MKNNKEYLTKADYNFIHTQKLMFLLDILIGVAIIFVLAQLAMLFTKKVIFIGILPIILGGCYTVPALIRRVKRVRAYWAERG